MLEAQSGRPDQEDVHILLVDDRPDNLEVLTALLRQPGVSLLTAGSGPDALELLLQHDVALALIDVRMPAMDGFELAELMRGTERTRRVPIIFVTAATPEPGRMFRGYEAGAVDFLFKPVDPHLLQSKVGVFIELFRQRQQLAAQVEEHKQLLNTAELLLGVLGHDLRAPLNAIVTAGELLRKMHPDDERTQQVANRIRSSSQRMTRLIRQLLDFATARLGQVPISPQPCSLRDLCETSVTEFATVAEDRFQVEIVGDPAGTWDPDRLQQVLSNLVGNAVQHGDTTAPIVIRVAGSDPQTIEVQVENRGEIPAAVRAQIFAPFTNSAVAAGSTGLGLYIVDQMTRLHGGEVRADSGGGRTVIRVRLPRHVSGIIDPPPVPSTG
jgi:two-component system, sensor histidine kinase and response regulator